MVRKVCDRCGKDIPIVSPMANAFTCKDCYPMLMINVRASSWSPIRSIDLCHDCSVSVYDFIRLAPVEEAKGETDINGVV